MDLTRRQNIIFQRIETLTSGSPSAIASIVAAFRSYRTAQSGSRDVISTVFTILKQDLDSAASIVGGLVDMLDDEEKRQGLLSAWNGFKVEVFIRTHHVWKLVIIFVNSATKSVS